jgi:RNase P subunit RPR2
LICASKKSFDNLLFGQATSEPHRTEMSLQQITRDIKTTDSVDVVKTALLEVLGYILESSNALSRLGRNDHRSSQEPAWERSRYFAGLQPDKMQTFRSTFINKDLSKFYHLLTGPVLNNWIPLFTDDDVNSLFKPFFFLPGQHLTGLLELSAALQTTLFQQTLQLVAHILHEILDQFTVKDACMLALNSQPSTKGLQLWNHYSTMICSLPDRLANAYAGKAIPETLNHRYAVKMHDISLGVMTTVLKVVFKIVFCKTCSRYLSIGTTRRRFCFWRSVRFQKVFCPTTHLCFC